MKKTTKKKRKVSKSKVRDKVAEEDFDKFADKVKELAKEIRAGICPIWQCGGELEYLEDRNWQEPDLRCKNCGALWRLEKRPK